jgi:hypothetical protein
VIFFGGTSSASPQFIEDQGLVELAPPKLFQRIRTKIAIASAMRYQPNTLNVCVWM